MTVYVKNEAMDFITLDENDQVIHDIESGDIHYIDNISKCIIECLSKPLSADELIDKLIKIFDGNLDEIRTDTLEFIQQLVEKRILLVVEDKHEN